MGVELSISYKAEFNWIMESWVDYNYTCSIVQQIGGHMHSEAKISVQLCNYIYGSINYWETIGKTNF